MVRLRTVLTAVLIAIATMAASEQRRQPPLTKLQPQSLNPLRREFNAASDRVRIILLLSPT